MLVILSLTCNSRNQNLLADFLRPFGYYLLTVQTYAAFESALDHAQTVHFALIDISGFDRQVWHYCDRLQVCHVPFFVLVPQFGSKLNHLSLLHGASACLGKPLNRQTLIQLIQHYCLPEQ